MITAYWSLKNSLFLPVRLADRWQTGKGFPPVDHGVTEYHEKSTNDGEVAEEKGKVKDQAIAEALNDDNSQQTHDSIFSVPFRDDSSGCDHHDL